MFLTHFGNPCLGWEASEEGSPMSDLLDVADLAALYKTTTKGIHTRRSRSPETLPPSFKLGGKVVWLRSTVNKWLEDREREQAVSDVA